MAQIQTTDLNSSDSEVMEELTEEELLEINAGSFWTWLGGAALVTAGVLTSETGIGSALIGAGGAVIASDSKSFKFKFW